MNRSLKKVVADEAAAEIQRRPGFCPAFDYPDAAHDKTESWVLQIQCAMATLQKRGMRPPAQQEKQGGAMQRSFCFFTYRIKPAKDVPHRGGRANQPARRLWQCAADF